MKRPPACDCHCGCCIPATTTDVDWDSIPQRFQIDTDPWSWTMPEGWTYQSVKYPSTAAFENVAFSTFAKSLSTVGQSNVAWILNSNKYTPSFGTWSAPSIASASNPFGLHNGYGAFQWTAADHDSLVQYWHDAGDRSPAVPGTYLNSHVKSMLDTSSNTSGATPFMTPDVAASYADEDSENGDFVSNLGDYQQTTSTFGSSQRIYIQRLSDGQCHWVCLVTLKPRFSMAMSIDPVLPYERTRRVSPAVSRLVGGTAYTNPPYLIDRGLGSTFLMQPDTGYSEDTRLVNWGGPLDFSLVSSEPPGGWRSWIELAYISDAPVNCMNDVQEMEPFTLTLVEQVNRVSLGPPQPTWSEWLDLMNQAFGLESPPTSMTIQRLADIV